MVSTVSSETWVVGPGGCGAGGELLSFLELDICYVKCWRNALHGDAFTCWDIPNWLLTYFSWNCRVGKVHIVIYSTDFYQTVHALSQEAAYSTPPNLQHGKIKGSSSWEQTSNWEIQDTLNMV